MRTKHPPQTTAYTIMEEMGNVVLSNFIQRIVPPRFSSHDFMDLFRSHFSVEYKQMLQVCPECEDEKHRNAKISNAIGRYLGNHQIGLRIEKIGVEHSKNINGTMSKASVWRKIM